MFTVKRRITVINVHMLIRIKLHSYSIGSWSKPITTEVHDACVNRLPTRIILIHKAERIRCLLDWACTPFLTLVQLCHDDSSFICANEPVLCKEVCFVQEALQCRDCVSNQGRRVPYSRQFEVPTK